MKARIIFDWLKKLVLRFALEKNGENKLPKNIPLFFIELSEIFVWKVIIEVMHTLVMRDCEIDFSTFHKL